MAYSVPIAVTRRPLADKNHATAITPADNAAIGPFHALFVGGAGNIAIVMAGDTTPVVLTAVAAGTYFPDLNFQGINATNTTATLLVGFG